MVEANLVKVIPLFVLSSEDEKFVRDCVDVIYDILILYGFKSDGVKRKGTVNNWLSCAARWTPVKFVKWKTAAFYASHFDDDDVQRLPPCPAEILTLSNPACLVGGVAHRWIRRLRRESPYQYSTFCETILQAKRGMPAVPEALLEKAEVDTIDTLTALKAVKASCMLSTLDGQRPHNRVAFELSYETMRCQLRRGVRELFTGETYTRDDRVEPFWPSTKANVL